MRSAIPSAFAGRFGMLMRLATVDIGAWVLPLVALALVAPRAGLGDRFVHYVVASNWASAIIAWLMLPSALLRLFLPSTDQISACVSLLLFALSHGADLADDQCRHRQGRGSRHRGLSPACSSRRCSCCYGLQMLLGITVPDDASRYHARRFPVFVSRQSRSSQNRCTW